MGRFTEGDGENPICYTWEGNIRRICRGKRGQRILRELCEALLALPERRLIANKLENKRTGEVCAIGALARYKGALPDFEDDGDSELTREVGENLGLGFMLTWELGYMNDEACRPLHLGARSVPLDVPITEETSGWGNGRPARTLYATVRGELRGYTPEQRWQRIYDWAANQVQWQLPALVAVNE